MHGQGQRRYSVEKFTPEQVRQDPSRPYQKLRIWFAGSRRVVRCKDLPGVLWQNGARTRPLRLLVPAPRPYHPRKNSRRRYRDPAYLLTTDLASPLSSLVQAYHDRWEIEVNHRDEQSLFGVDQAQVRHPASVPRQPTFTVATYSLVLLASLQTFGMVRNQAFAPLPRRHRAASRPSLLDILSQLRSQIDEKPISLFGKPAFSPKLLTCAFG